MKLLSLTLLASAVFCLFTSCGKTYTTPIRGGKVFTQKPLDKKILEDHGEGYEQRGDYLTKAQGLQPEEGESYEEFENRLINTLVIQEHDIVAYGNVIGKQESGIRNLAEQLEQLKEQNMDLRLQLQGNLEEHQKRKYAPTAFRSYTVQKGDTLQKISEKFFGTHTGWLALYQFNQFYISNPNLIEVGELVWIPPLVGQ